jgi:Fic family protein
LSLQGKKTQQTPATLTKIWGVNLEAARKNAEKLAEVGFFEKRGSRGEPAFWVPFLYRDALQMVQGVAK